MNRSFSYFEVAKGAFDLEQGHLSVEKGDFLTPQKGKNLHPSAPSSHNESFRLYLRRKIAGYFR